MSVGVGYSAFPLVDLYFNFFFSYFRRSYLSGIMIVLQTPTTLPDLSPVYDLRFLFLYDKIDFFCSAQDDWGASPYSGICSTSEVSFKFGGVSSSLSSECRELPTIKGELEITGKRYYLLQVDVSVCILLNIQMNSPCQKIRCKKMGLFYLILLMSKQFCNKKMFKRLCIL